MKLFWLRPFILLLILILSFSASAQETVVVASEQKPLQSLAAQVHESISVPSAYSSKEGLHLDYFNGEAQWNLKIRNTDSTRLKRYLYLKPLNGAIDVRESLQGPVIGKFGTGYPKSIQGGKLNHSYFELNFAPGETKELFFTLRSRHSIDLNLWLGTFDELTRMEKLDEHWFLFYLGIVLGIIIYNFLIYLSIKDRTYLWYLLFSLSYATTIFLMKGYADIYLDFLEITLSNYLQTASGLALLTSTWFAFYFLEIPAHFKNQLRVFQGITALCVVAILVDWTPLQENYPAIVGPSMDLFILAGEFYLFYLAIRMLKKSPFAKFYVFSWSFIIVAVSSWYLTTLNVLPNDNFSTNALLISSLGHLITLSFALAYRMKIAEKEKTQSDLKARDKLKYQRLVRVLSHDIGNSLTNLQLLLHLMQRDRNQNHSLEKIWVRFEKLQKTALNMENILKHVRTEEASQFDSEKLKQSTLTVREVFEGCQEIFESKLSQKNIDLQISGDLDLQISGDSSVFINNILSNILSNAIKFSKQGGQIQMTSHESSHQVCLEIRDHGVGMSSEQIDSLFRHRISSSKRGTLDEGGTGLGVQIMQDYVKSMNGELEVESIVGEGTVIRLRFPAVR